MSESLHGNPNLDRDGQRLNAGDRVTLVSPIPFLRRTFESARRDVNRGGLAKDSIEANAGPINGNLLGEDKLPPYWLVDLDNPVFFAKTNKDDSMDVKELSRIRESSMNLRKIVVEDS